MRPSAATQIYHEGTKSSKGHTLNSLGISKRSDPERRLQEQNIPNLIRQTIPQAQAQPAGLPRWSPMASPRFSMGPTAYPQQFAPGETVVVVDAHDPIFMNGPTPMAPMSI